VGEYVLLKVNLEKNPLKLGSFRKLATRFCGSFQILDKIVSVACMHPFLASMNVNNVFHVSLLKKYVHDPNHVIYWNLIQMERERDLLVQTVNILDKNVKILWSQVIELVKFQWTCYSPEDATWEHEDGMHEEYPCLFEYI
jgi:hypothetical protein